MKAYAQRECATCGELGPSAGTCEHAHVAGTISPVAAALAALTPPGPKAPPGHVVVCRGCVRGSDAPNAIAPVPAWAPCARCELVAVRPLFVREARR